MCYILFLWGAGGPGEHCLALMKRFPWKQPPEPPRLLPGLYAKADPGDSGYNFPY